MPVGCLRSTIRRVPTSMAAEQASLSGRAFVSPKSAMAKRIVRTELVLSMGTTLLTSPIESALK